MSPNRLSILFLSLCLLSAKPLFSQSTVKDEVDQARQSIEKTGKAFNWNEYDTTSKIPGDNIRLEDIQGLWNAYNGIFKFGDMANSMALVQPFPIEIKEDKYRRNLESKFVKFTLSKNEITCKKEGDFGTINKLTDKLLVITWKQGENYTRYYYEKK